LRTWTGTTTFRWPSEGSMSQPLHAHNALELCGERFTPGDVLPVWRYVGRWGKYGRSVFGIRRGDACEVVQRMLRHIGAGRGAFESIKREMLRLEHPADPLLHQVGEHTVGLIRAQACEPSATPLPGPPILLTLGDGKTFLAFDDLGRARGWAKRVEVVLRRRPQWAAFYGEYWPWCANQFRPRIAETGRAHGFTEMEALLDEVLERQRAEQARTPVRSR
jgi:hypothetical protein